MPSGNRWSAPYRHSDHAWAALFEKYRATPEYRLVTSGFMLADFKHIFALALQVGLGISTLLSVVALPLAAARQAGAVALFAATLWTTHALSSRRVTAAVGGIWRLPTPVRLL